MGSTPNTTMTAAHDGRRDAPAARIRASRSAGHRRARGPLRRRRLSRPASTSTATAPSCTATRAPRRPRRVAQPEAGVGRQHAALERVVEARKRDQRRRRRAARRRRACRAAASSATSAGATQDARPQSCGETRRAGDAARRQAPQDGQVAERVVEGAEGAGEHQLAGAAAQRLVHGQLAVGLVLAHRVADQLDAGRPRRSRVGRRQRVEVADHDVGRDARRRAGSGRRRRRRRPGRPPRPRRGSTPAPRSRRRGRRRRAAHPARAGRRRLAAAALTARAARPRPGKAAS